MREIVSHDSTEPNEWLVKVTDNETMIDNPPQDRAMGEVAGEEGVHQDELEVTDMVDDGDTVLVTVVQMWNFTTPS